MVGRTACLVLIGILTLDPAAAEASGAKAVQGIEARLIERTNDPSDHRALAEHYRRRAEDARNDASRHEHMSHAYEFGSRLEAKAHCRDLVALFEKEAEAFDALAALHEKEARAAGQ